ncbi:ABC transporter substrate-binding protein [Leifsonia sp. NPDC058194]|uniref:ABC transporter substrate-binding protein n=1 Tax=Leifsonia sp. NPDC058194 TaxID=3346374 RepID=UPI0036DE2167
MESRTRKWLTRAVAAAAAATVAIGGMTACSSSGSSDTSGGKTTVNWWSWNPDDTQDKQWITAFEKEHPDITIKHRFIQYSDYVNAVRLAATSNSGPDVFGLQVGALTTQFAPLATDLAPLAAKNIGADWKDQLLETQQLAVDGKQVGLPWMITGGGLLWYNKNILDQAGVKPPTTLAEWKDACTKITALGKTCFVQGAKDDWVNIDVYQSIINQITPGTFYKAVQGKAKFDSADFVKAFAVWKQLFDDGIVQPGALGQTEYPDVSDIFSKGDAAMIALGTWNDDHMTKPTLASLAPTYGDQITSQVFVPTAFPDVVGGAKETGRLFGGPDVGWAISAKSKVKEAAFTLVQWLTSSKTAQTMIGKTLQTPALKSVPVDASELAAPDVQKPALEDQAKQITDLIGARQIQDADVQTALGQALSSVASGQMSPEDAAASVQKAIDAIAK